MPDIDPRVALASERTLLAWVRTGLAMMGFGFVIARFGLFLRELASMSPQSVELEPAKSFWQAGSLWIGIGLVVCGGLVSLLAGLQHVRLVDRLSRGEPYRPRRLSLGVVVAILIAVTGGLMAAYLVSYG